MLFLQIIQIVPSHGDQDDSFQYMSTFTVTTIPSYVVVSIPNIFMSNL